MTPLGLTRVTFLNLSGNLCRSKMGVQIFENSYYLPTAISLLPYPTFCVKCYHLSQISLLLNTTSVPLHKDVIFICIIRQLNFKFGHPDFSIRAKKSTKFFYLRIFGSELALIFYRIYDKK